MLALKRDAGREARTAPRGIKAADHADEYGDDDGNDHQSDDDFLHNFPTSIWLKTCISIPS